MKDWEGRQDRQKRWTYRREMDAEVVVKEEYNGTAYENEKMLQYK
jgi:hypothetical protein